MFILSLFALFLIINIFECCLCGYMQKFPLALGFNNLVTNTVKTRKPKNP